MKTVVLALMVLVVVSQGEFSVQETHKTCSIFNSKCFVDMSEVSSNNGLKREKK